MYKGTYPGSHFSAARRCVAGGRSRAIRGLAALFLATSCTACAHVEADYAAADQADRPTRLLQQEDLVYVGAFRLPAGGRDGATFEYGGKAIAFNPGKNSLFITGHDHHQLTAEIEIPGLVDSTDYEELPVARFLQPFSDATNGKLSDINPGDPNGQKVGGHLVRGEKLIVSAYSYYDGAGTQRATHFVRPLSLSSDGPVMGPLALGQRVHFTGGYMTEVPPEWRSALGGRALTGNCCRAIISQQSYGPAVSSFDPDRLIEGDTDSVTDLLHYTSRNPLGPGENTQNPYFNLTTKIEGVVFPHNTASVLFFGYHGTGPYCYGTGEKCNDPARRSQGTHAYPYVYQVWAYDANDLASVKRRKKSPFRVRPYAVWTFNLPFEKDGAHYLGGAAYDPASDLIYVSQRNGKGPMPIIHAFRVTRKEN